ncbi:unnamed protein product [Vitrella brassicaformis CCMP3155]|uniref:Uncharacterized protein n=1 Tax=Vitrella brassicaformis (strain CCMP3155) TaxID=1169540 RepID=A0A0G4EK26_VITBC|nr:unnamed protein product [Vitrella brassicaformis CCMP3155]|eukprot:CEL96898.1 unnamed protein product [Vitrella brassicaformis CCMP3155]
MMASSSSSEKDELHGVPTEGVAEGGEGKTEDSESGLTEAGNTHTQAMMETAAAQDVANTNGGGSAVLTEEAQQGASSSSINIRNCLSAVLKTTYQISVLKALIEKDVLSSATDEDSLEETFNQIPNRSYKAMASQSGDVAKINLKTWTSGDFVLEPKALEFIPAQRLPHAPTFWYPYDSLSTIDYHIISTKKENYHQVLVLDFQESKTPNLLVSFKDPETDVVKDVMDILQQQATVPIKDQSKGKFYAAGGGGGADLVTARVEILEMVPPKTSKSYEIKSGWTPGLLIIDNSFFIFYPSTHRDAFFVGYGGLRSVGNTSIMSPKDVVVNHIDKGLPGLDIKFHNLEDVELLLESVRTFNKTGADIQIYSLPKDSPADSDSPSASSSFQCNSTADMLRSSSPSSWAVPSLHLRRATEFQVRWRGYAVSFSNPKLEAEVLPPGMAERVEGRVEFSDSRIDFVSSKFKQRILFDKLKLVEFNRSTRLVRLHFTQTDDDGEEDDEFLDVDLKPLGGPQNPVDEFRQAIKDRNDNRPKDDQIELKDLETNSRESHGVAWRLDHHTHTHTYTDTLYVSFLTHMNESMDVCMSAESVAAAAAAAAGQAAGPAAGGGPPPAAAGFPGRLLSAFMPGLSTALENMQQGMIAAYNAGLDQGDQNDPDTNNQTSNQ